MRSIFFWSLLAVATKMGVSVNAQGILGLSNLGESTAYSLEVASDRWLAIPFGAGDLPGAGRFWRIDSVQFLMGEPSGSPEGLAVAIHDFDRSAGPSKVIIGKLSGVAPSSSGILTYTASDLLIPDYGSLWLVLTSETPADTGSFYVNVASTSNYLFHDDWGMGGNWTSSDGLNWEVGIIGDRLQFAIYATPVPKLAINAGDDQIELRWEGFEGVTYQVQSRASLTDSEWTDVDGPLTGDGSELTVPVPVSSDGSYFRVEVLSEQ